MSEDFIRYLIEKEKKSKKGIDFDEFRELVLYGGTKKRKPLDLEEIESYFIEKGYDDYVKESLIKNLKNTLWGWKKNIGGYNKRKLIKEIISWEKRGQKKEVPSMNPYYYDKKFESPYLKKAHNIAEFIRETIAFLPLDKQREILRELAKQGFEDVVYLVELKGLKRRDPKYKLEF